MYVRPHHLKYSWVGSPCGNWTVMRFLAGGLCMKPKLHDTCIHWRPASRVSLLFLVPLVGAKQTFQLEWVWSELKPCQNLFCFLPKSRWGQICLFFTKLAGDTTCIWTHKDDPRALGQVGARRRPGSDWDSEWIQAKASLNGTRFIFNLSLFTKDRKIKVC